MPRARADQSAQVRLRMEVLALDGQNPRPSNYSIAKTCSTKLGRAVAVSTVRSILKRFRDDGQDIPEDARRPGRPEDFGFRMKRCELLEQKK